jgi:hypothetical protein
VTAQTENTDQPDRKINILTYSIRLVEMSPIINMNIELTNGYEVAARM